MSKEDPFPWDDPALIYIGAVVGVAFIFMFAKEIFGFFGV